MEEFLTECLKNLEPLTGIRQLYFLEQDPDGERKIGVLIKGMLLTCEEFSYIPEKDQQKIISDMMRKDQNYDALNSRTVNKWFSLFKDFYWTRANSEHKEPEPQTGPLPPLSDDTMKKLHEFWGKLVEKTEPKFMGLNLTMDQIRYEDAMRLEGEEEKPKGTTYDAPTWTVPVEDDDGKIIKEYSIKAATMEKAKEILELSIKQGVI